MGSESIAVGQEILVKHDDFESAKIDVGGQWQAYHGRNELIPTNEMDVIDALTTNGSLEVVFWDDKDEDTPLMEEVCHVL